MRRRSRPLWECSPASSCSGFEAIPFDPSAPPLRLQRLVPLEAASHPSECVGQQARTVSLGDPQIVCHFLLRAVEEEPEQEDAPLPLVERAGGAGDQSSVEHQVLERLALPAPNPPPPAA